MATPSVEGEAIALPSTVCMISPETDSPAPAIIAASTRGMRMLQMMRMSFWLSLILAKASMQSFKDMFDEPIKRQTTDSAATAAARAAITASFPALAPCLAPIMPRR